MRAVLYSGATTSEYGLCLARSGGIVLGVGLRAEFEQKAQATVIERHGRNTIAFIGGRDARGNVQFPKTPIPVRPGATGREAFEDVRLADLSDRKSTRLNSSH